MINGSCNCLRRLSIKYPPRLEVLNEGKTTFYIKSKKGTDVKRVSFECQGCGVKGFKNTQIVMDHRDPVVDVTDGFINMWDWIDSLFCPKSNWQRLCTTCNYIKTSKENEMRVINKKEK